MSALRPLLILPLVLSVACGDKENADSGADSGAITGDADAGADVFSSNCAGCHGADGSGTDSGPSLIERVPDLTEAELEDTVLNGTDSMPSFGSLSDQDVADVVAYLVDTFG